MFNLSKLSNNEIHETYGQGIKDQKALGDQKFLFGFKFNF